jgi:hypothetical protein
MKVLIANATLLLGLYTSTAYGQLTDQNSEPLLSSNFLILLGVVVVGGYFYLRRKK